MASKAIAGINSTVAATLGSVTGFLNHYGNELGSIVTVLETAFGALPVPPATAANVKNILDDLKGSVSAVTEAANTLNGIEVNGASNEVVVNESDIDAAVQRIAGPLIAAAVAEAVAKAQAGNGGGNA